MTERPTLVVGLMSGTSLDGMDAALVRFSGPIHAELVGFHSRPYTAAERRLLEEAIERGDAASLARMHVRLGVWAAEAVETLLLHTHVSPLDLDVIAFHGQTVWHQPPLVSWQLGEPAILAEQFGVRVVSSFRSRDVAAGGEGAPLVPMADVLLFGGEQPRVLLNLGGIANLSYVVKRDVDEGALAFDTGPGMVVIDMLARMIDPLLPYDRDGMLWKEGTPREDVLGELLDDPYFAREPPKSTGREHFGVGYAEALADKVPGPDGVATAVELTARSVANAVRRWVPSTGPESEADGGIDFVVSGGGTHHPGVMRSLEACLGVSVRRFADVFFTGDAKEAVAFALLGYLTVHGQPGNLPAATGASGPRVLGAITPP